MARPRLEIGETGKITLRQQPDGTYHARCQYRGEDGQLHTIQRSGKSQTAAERTCRKAAQQKATENNNEIGPNTELTKLINSWWDTILTRNQSGNLTNSTIDNYERTKTRVETGIGHLKIRECTATRLGTWVKKEAGTHPSVHRDLRRTLSDVFTHGMSIDAIKHNPGAAITPAVTKRKDTAALTVEEVIQLRQTIKKFEDNGTKPRTKKGKRLGGKPRTPYLADIVELLLGTGLRIGEVLGLRWEDVDLVSTPATVTVNGALKTRKAKPGEPSLYWEPKPKSKSSRRTLSLPPFAADVLLKLHVANDKGHEWVFSSGRGTPRYPANVRTDLRAACGETFEGLTPHTLRRTVATIVEAEADIRTASMMLGHSEIAVTERAYVRRGHVAPDTSRLLEGAMGNEFRE